MTAGHPVDIAWLDLLTAGALLLVAVAVSAWERLGLGRQIIWGGIRATVQLLIVGHVLRWVFALDRWYVVLVALLVMVLFATLAATDRLKVAKHYRQHLRAICAGAIFLGSLLTLAYVDSWVVAITPWYNPRYLIPMFGMIVANAMNGATLAAERLQSEMVARRGEIEAMLALGASVRQASAEPVRKALAAALIPSINGLAVVGVVSLPGMMTGQILAGADPTMAVRYQLVVAFMLTAATAVTAVGVVWWYRSLFFTPAAQLTLRVLPPA
jgi:putative ABC transport system permease protein